MYKIGTRVKFTAPDLFNPNDGMTGIVVPENEVSERTRPRDTDMVVRADAKSFSFRTRRWVPAGFAAWTASRYWKPIIPDGHKPAKWEDCEWQPEKETADAGV